MKQLPFLAEQNLIAASYHPALQCENITYPCLPVVVQVEITQIKSCLKYIHIKCLITSYSDFQLGLVLF